MEQLSEEALVAAARSGDRAALESLLLRYQPTVYGYGMHMCHNPEDAKDILQETLLAMARSFREFRGGSSISTWVYTIARRFCLKRRRQGRSVSADLGFLENSDAADAPHPGPGPEDQIHAREVGHAVAQAIAELPPLYREVFVLRDVDGLTAAAVAEILEIGIEAVKSRLHRARTTVRESLAAMLDSEMPVARSRKPGCPDIVSLFSRHLEGEISADLCATMERHVENCPDCRGRCDSLQKTLQLCRTAPSPQVPQAVQSSIRKELRKVLDHKP